MKTEKRTITNESGKTITMMIDPANTNQHIPYVVDWTISPTQWKRIVSESDNTSWQNEHGATIQFTCHPFSAGCKHPGRI